KRVSSLPEKIQRIPVSNDLCKHILMSVTPPRITVLRIDQTSDGVQSIAGHMGRHTLRCRYHAIVYNENTVIKATDKSLCDNALRIFTGMVKGHNSLLPRFYINTCTISMITIQRLK